MTALEGKRKRGLSKKVFKKGGEDNTAFAARYYFIAWTEREDRRRKGIEK
jgi:hypothetical protein